MTQVERRALLALMEFVLAREDKTSLGIGLRRFKALIELEDSAQQLRERIAEE